MTKTEMASRRSRNRRDKRRAGLAREAIWLAWPDYRLSATHPSMFGRQRRALQTLPPALNIALRTLQIRLLR